MKISIVVWEIDRKVVRITGRGMSTLTVTKRTIHFVDWAAIIGVNLSISSNEAKTMIEALELAVMVAQYMDSYVPNSARKLIEHLEGFEA